MLALRTLAEVAHHVRLHVGRKYFAFGNVLGDPHAEISGARAEVCNLHSGFQMQGAYDLLGLLPRVTFGIVEFFRPLLRIVKSAMEAAVAMATHMIVFRRNPVSHLRERHTASQR